MNLAVLSSMTATFFMRSAQRQTRIPTNIASPCKVMVFGCRPAGCSIGRPEEPGPGLSIELHADRFGDERGPRRTFDFDRVFRGNAHTALDRVDRFDLLAQADARSGLHLSSKADPVRAIIQAARALL